MEDEDEDKPKYYNPVVKEAIYRHRRNNPEKYNEYMRNYYKRKSTDAVWRENRLQKCRIANARYRAKLREGKEPKPRGRPKKQNQRSV